MKKLEKYGMIISKSINNYEPTDIRYLKPTIYCEDIEKDEALVMQSVDVVKDKNYDLKYFTPNNVALLRWQADEALKEYNDILTNYVLKNNLGPKYDNITDKTEIISMTSSMVYTMIKYAQTAIICSYTCIEAFVNLSIPVDYEYTFKNNKGIKEVYEKEQIERWLPLSTKLKDIMCHIYGTPQINQEKLWEMFIKLEEMRNAIIHQKSINTNDFYIKYFEEKTIEIINVYNEVINFFSLKSTKNKNFSLMIWPFIREEKGIAIPVIQKRFEPSFLNIIRNENGEDKKYIIINVKEDK